MRHLRLKGFQILKESIGTRHVADPDLPKDPHQFNKAIGLPTHPATNLPHKLMPYQEYVIEYPGKDLAINKANKIGITEAFLRKLTFMGVVGDCAGYQIMLGAQDRNLAIENMRRLQALFDDSDLLRPLVKRRIITKLELWNGTVYFVMPRTAKGMRGWPRLKVAFMDEAAHYGLLDDEPILAATTARLANTDGYLFLASTPQGQRGFFYRIMTESQAGRLPFMVKEWDYTVALNVLISQEFIDKEKARLGPLFSQEYECKFLGAQNAAIPEYVLRGAEDDYEPEVW